MRYNTMPWDKGFKVEEFRQACADERAKHALQGQKANESGLLFEKLIEAGCDHYYKAGKANIVKIPEPFRVLRKLQGGKANVQFIKHAEPDFMGVSEFGQCIVFEAKYTSKDNLDTGVLTARQWESLERFAAIKARVNVAVGIRDKYYFVPWQIFKDAKRIYGHKYLSQEDLEPYEVEDRGWAVLFLDYINPLRAYYAYKEAIERS